MDTGTTHQGNILQGRIHLEDITHLATNRIQDSIHLSLAITHHLASIHLDIQVLLLLAILHLEDILLLVVILLVVILHRVVIHHLAVIRRHITDDCCSMDCSNEIEITKSSCCLCICRATNLR
jgi:hypothetical protein